MPYFSTDTVAAQRALETHCQVLLMAKNGVDGVYTADPRLDPDATKLSRVTYEEALALNLKVVDAAAFSICMDNRLPMVVFGLEGPDQVTRVLRGERLGTLVTAAK
jgi:uridylate kinase